MRRNSRFLAKPEAIQKRASFEVRNHVSHPLRLGSGRSSNRNRPLSPSVNTSRHIITNPGSMSDIVISKCLRAHYLYEAFRAGFTGRGAIMQATRLPGSSAGERKL